MNIVEQFLKNKKKKKRKMFNILLTLTILTGLALIISSLFLFWTSFFLKKQEKSFDDLCKEALVQAELIKMEEDRIAKRNAQEKYRSIYDE